MLSSSKNLLACRTGTQSRSKAPFWNVSIAVGAACSLAAWAIKAEPQFAPECPSRGTLEVVKNPTAWADQCFAAVNGRNPQLGRIGESDSAMRDVDLDGADERLEIRGTGNSSKSIYVFKVAARGFIYLGELGAHPSFTVALDAAGIPTISYIHRFGVDDLYLKRIQYRDGQYVEISSDKVR